MWDGPDSTSGLAREDTVLVPSQLSLLQLLVLLCSESLVVGVACSPSLQSSPTALLPVAATVVAGVVTDDAVLPLELAPLPANDDDDDCCALGSGGAFCAI